MTRDLRAQTPQRAIPPQSLKGQACGPRPLPQGRRCALERETRARRGPGTPRALALPEWRRSLPVSGLHHPGPRLTAVRWGRKSVRSEGLGRTTTRRSESSARPPRNRRLQHRSVIFKHLICATIEICAVLPWWHSQ